MFSSGAKAMSLLVKYSANRKKTDYKGVEIKGQWPFLVASSLSLCFPNIFLLH